MQIRSSEVYLEEQLCTVRHFTFFPYYISNEKTHIALASEELMPSGYNGGGGASARFKEESSGHNPCDENRGSADLSFISAMKYWKICEMSLVICILG